MFFSEYFRNYSLVHRTAASFYLYTADIPYFVRQRRFFLLPKQARQQTVVVSPILLHLKVVLILLILNNATALKQVAIK